MPQEALHALHGGRSGSSRQADVEEDSLQGVKAHKAAEVLVVHDSKIDTHENYEPAVHGLELQSNAVCVLLWVKAARAHGISAVKASSVPSHRYGNVQLYERLQDSEKSRGK